MPCSCRRDKALQKVQSFYVPSKRAFTKIDPISTYSRRVQVSDSAQLIYTVQDSDSSDWNFSATTKADQLCFNCAMKHIALANVLLQSGKQQDICVASGQLILAAAHYKQYSQSASDYCTALAHAIVRDIRHPAKWLPQFVSLMEYAIQPVQQLQPFWDTSKDPFGMGFLSQPAGQYIAAVVNLSAAFSLLFTQVGYLQLNKAYAVGYIVRAVTLPIPGAGFMFGDYAPAQYNVKKARQAWKIVQQMHLNDAAYHECRQRLLKLIQRYANMYIMVSNQISAGRLVQKTSFVPASHYSTMSDSQLHRQLQDLRRQHIRQASDSAAS